MSADEDYPGQPFEGDWDPDSPDRLQDLLDCVYRAGMEAQADSLAAGEIEPGARLTEDLAREARLHTDIRLERILMQRLFGEEPPKFFDTQGRFITPVYLPLGAPWSGASPEQLIQAGQDPHEFILIAGTLKYGGEEGLVLARSIVDGSFFDKMAEQNARMRELGLEED